MLIRDRGAGYETGVAGIMQLHAHTPGKVDGIKPIKNIGK